MPNLLTKTVKPLKAIYIDAKTENDEKLAYVDLLDFSRAQAEKIDDLEKKLKGAETRLETHLKAHEAEKAEAVRVARSEERSAIDMSSKEIIDAGIESLKSGRKDFDEFLQTSESLSLNLVEQVLTPLFTDPKEIKKNLASAIAKAVNDLGKSSVLNVRLNSDDFGDPADLLQVAQELEDNNISIEIDPTLESGESTFELLVGQYEISLPEHWSLVHGLIRDAIQSSMPSELKT